MKVYIAQLLCPKRHCIVALAFEMTAEEEPRDFKKETADTLWRAFAAGAFNQWCAICRAPMVDWHAEVDVTGFASLEEARPHLKHIQESQMITRAIIDATKAKASSN
jgi:hypothetical protein